MLEQAGASVTSAPLFGDSYLNSYLSGGGKRSGLVIAAYMRRLLTIARGGRFHLIWIEKELFPFLPAGFEALVRRYDAPWVVDIDDAIFHNYDRRPLLAGKLKQLVREPACISAGSPYLYDWARSLGAAQVELIPTVVNPARYPVRCARDDGTVRIGWIGTPANSAYLDSVIGALNEIGRSRAVQLVTIGASRLVDLTVPQVQHAWSDDTEGELLASVDIGVMPLPDSPWERGKCGYKLIQYMAAGKPVIASPVGVNTEIVTQDVGYLASKPAQWRRALLRMIDDPEGRRRMGVAGRVRVETHYSSAVTAPRLVSLFSKLVR
jgi:glycosyltransferase involved in cell wall biosynthesis